MDGETLDRPTATLQRERNWRSIFGISSDAPMAKIMLPADMWVSAKIAGLNGSSSQQRRKPDGH